VRAWTGEVTERLREVSDLALLVGQVLLGQEAHVVAESDHALEQRPRVVATPHHGVRPDQPERAREQHARFAGQAIVARRGLVPKDQAVCMSSSSIAFTIPGNARVCRYEDTAQAIAAQTMTAGTGGSSFGDIIVFHDALSLARGHLPLGVLRDSDDHHFHGDRMGVGNAFTITCKDASGAIQTACDSNTESATIAVMLKGSIQTPNFMSSVDREANFTVTGLNSMTATLDGDSSFSLDTTLNSVFHPGVTSTLMFDATASYKAITFASADRDNITGGSASFEVKAHRTVTGTGSGSGSNHDVDKSFDVHADLTFNADHTATLVLDGMHTFKIDLRTGKVTRVVI